MSSRADLHVHSRHSDRPSEWFLRRIGAPESFTEPRVVYEKAREAGMDFVTITDHDTIAGALEIAHLPGVFLSAEITASFPEDGCKIHLLVYGMSEPQFAEIDRLRANVYELRDYLHAEGLVSSVAHPLFAVNDKLTIAHVEKLLVLFKRFEGINGARDARASILTRAMLENLSGAMIFEMADRYRIDPKDPEPWRKDLTAGSDDHGGLSIASAFTTTPPAATVKELLGHLAAGRSEASGSSGSSLKLARSFYAIAYRYYRERLLGGDPARGDLFSEIFSRILEEEPAGAKRRGVAWGKLARSFSLKPRKKTMGRVDATIARELTRLAALTRGQRPGPVEQRCFDVAARLSQQLSYAAVRRCLKYLGKGKLTESLQTVSSLGPVALCIAPYLTAFHTQHKDEPLHREVARHFPATLLLERRSHRRAWFTDTWAEVNGVAVTVRTCARLAAEQRRDLRILTCEPPNPGMEELPNVVRFAPVGRFRLPEYPEQPIAFPPVLEILEHCEREKISEVIVSTPGPMGLAGLAAARLLGLEVRGIYHTDFPQYVRTLTESPMLETFTVKYMRWFFEQMDVLYAPSRETARQLAAEGFAPRRLRLLPRGVDLELFNPAKRDQAFWHRMGAGDGFKFLYVGRISKEKNLDVLLEAFLEVRRTGCDAELVLVGDGPHLVELRQRYSRSDVLFTGYLLGDALASAYAGADVFVFPSTTDTFGNVVLEAQASGLPAIVTNRGGAQEVIAPGTSGLVVEGLSSRAMAEAMVRLCRDEDLRLAQREAALTLARGNHWNHLLDELCGTFHPIPTRQTPAHVRAAATSTRFSATA